MKQINRYIKYGLIIALTIASSCKRDDATAPEPTISINIQSPTEGAVIGSGETLHISADVSSPVDLHGYEWQLRDKEDATEIGRGEDHVHGKDINISANYTGNVTKVTNAELEITVIVSHGGREASKKVNVTLQP